MQQFRCLLCWSQSGRRMRRMPFARGFSSARRKSRWIWTVTLDCTSFDPVERPPNRTSGGLYREARWKARLGGSTGGPRPGARLVQGAVLFHSTGPTRRCRAPLLRHPGGGRCSLPVDLFSCFLLLCVAVFFFFCTRLVPTVGCPFLSPLSSVGSVARRRRWDSLCAGHRPRCRLCAQRSRRPLDAVLRCIAKLRCHQLDTPHTPDLFGFDRDQV